MGGRLGNNPLHYVPDVYYMCVFHCHVFANHVRDRTPQKLVYLEYLLAYYEDTVRLRQDTSLFTGHSV